MCSEKTEKKRLRRATGLPADSQKAGSSGRQSSIQRPGRVATATGAVCCRVVGVGAAMGQNGDAPSFPRRCCRAELVFRCAHRRCPPVVRPRPPVCAPARPAERIGPVTATEESPATGRALFEAGAAVAGTMSRNAAAVVYLDPAARVAVRLEDRLARCLRAAADEAAGIGVARERARAGAVLASAVEHGVALSRGGRPVRTDGFFTARTGGRSAADTVTEAVVAAARCSHDERRVRHLGYLLAEVASSPDLDAALVDRALTLAAGLTWRQLVLLAGVGRRDRAPL